MKPRSLLIPMIFVTTAAIADTGSQRFEPSDAQSQAAALLSAPHAFASKAEGQRRTDLRAPTMDAQTSAAALLSRPRATGSAKASSSLNQSSRATARVTVWADAQAQAAALLSGSRTTTDAELRAQRTQRSVRTGG
jgi:hypothetical protein